LITLKTQRDEEGFKLLSLELGSSEDYEAGESKVKK
jgi:hypothetical protein